tara:strand:- start:2952 stop:3206 length:255 start_codon:yes stop_codon:yes gene_type:complete
MSKDDYNTYVVQVSKKYEPLQVNAVSAEEAVRIAKELPWGEPVDNVTASLEEPNDEQIAQTMQELEEELLSNTNRFCINGNCED